MQTFSYMQRSGDAQKDRLKTLFYLFLLFVYEPLTTIYPFLPPLFGFVLWAIFRQANMYTLLFAFAYIYLYEVDHDFLRYMLFLNLFLTINFLHIMQRYIFWPVILKFLGVLFFYLGIFVLYHFFDYLLQVNYRIDLFLLLYYAIVDIAVLMVVYEK